MAELFYVGCGGFIGAAMRFLITKASAQHAPWFPFGTLISNVIVMKT